MTLGTHHVRFEPDRLANVVASIVELVVYFFLSNEVFERIDVFGKRE